MSTVGTVTRAFELAKGGSCQRISEIRRQLEREGCRDVGLHLDSPTLKRQLRALINAKQAARSI